MHRRPPKFECVESHIMNFDLILNNSRQIPKNCDFFKFQDLDMIISAYGHKWCCTRVYLQRSKENCVWKTLKIIESSQVISWFLSVLNHSLLKDWRIFSELVYLAMKFHFNRVWCTSSFWMQIWFGQALKIKTVI